MTSTGIVSVKAIRPQDAATLILLDRQGDEVRVLMGRRSNRHVFVPGKYVFPGGRTDPSDSRIPVAGELNPCDETRLVGAGRRPSQARARAIALSAIRETYEEAGLLVGRKQLFPSRNPAWSAFAEHGISPSLDLLRYVARAITPPGSIRRFDTRFFACWREAVALELPSGGVSDELSALDWVTLDQALRLDIAEITASILSHLRERLASDPDLRSDAPIPFFRFARVEESRTFTQTL